MTCIIPNKILTTSGKAAGIAGMCITPTQFEQRLGDYGQYCPVNLANKGELVDCSVTKSLKYATEFQGKNIYIGKLCKLRK